MFIVVKKNMVVAVLLILIVMFSFATVIKTQSKTASSPINKTVVVDAGHGGI